VARKKFAGRRYCREVVDSSLVIDLNELAGGVQEAVVTESDTLVGTVQQGGSSWRAKRPSRSVEFE
jgi:hypothetical protein